MSNEQTVRRQVMGRRIHARRERAGWSQHELGERAGVTRATVGHWEAGHSVPRWSAMWTLAEALEVPPHWLVAPLVVDFGDVRPGEEEPDPGSGASSDTTPQGETKGPHPAVGGPPPPGGSNEDRIDRLERQSDLVMDLLLKLRRELRGQRRELRGQRR